MRQDTLVFLLKPDTKQILLAMKKRGFGAGKFNGVGGKVAPGESIAAAAVREANEEVGVTIAESDLTPIAHLTFHFDQKPDWSIECHTFAAEHWEGEPTESEEMAPEWYAWSDIPFERMWIDDRYWLPNVLRGEYIDATFIFVSDGSALMTYDIKGRQRED